MKKGMAILTAIIGMGVGASASGYVVGKEVKKKSSKADKFKTYYNMLNQWLALKQENKNLAQYFKDNKYRTIAIYGMGEMGTRLLEELKSSDIEVTCAIDHNASNTFSEIKVLNSDDVIPEVDAIIVTAVFAFEEIEKELSKQTDCPIISLEDVVYEV